MSKDNIVEIKPEYVYLTIPAEYVCVYHKLLVYMADFGKTLIDDCNALCGKKNKNVITCWNLFQAACSAHALGNTKQADLFINYIKGQLNIIYTGQDKEVYNSTLPVKVTDDGYLQAVVSCGNDTKFYVDAETGELYKLYKDDKGEYKQYLLDNPHLLVRDRRN